MSFLSRAGAGPDDQLRATAAAASVIAVCAVGCGSSSSGTGSSPGAITWWVPSPDPTAGTLNAAAAAFTKQTGIKVDVEATPWADYLTKITTAAVSGHGPDVIEIGNTWASTLGNSNAFMPWTSAMFQAIGGRDQFVRASMGVTGPPGEPAISVPFLGQTWLPQYNKKLFAAAGITSTPRTWSEFTADAKKLTDPAKGVYGLAMTLNEPTSDASWDWVGFRQNGGDFYQSGQPNVDSAADSASLTQFIQ